MIEKIILVVAVAIAMVAASPAGATEPTGFNAFSILKLETPIVDQDGTVRISAARAAALRECADTISRRYIQRTYGVREITMYRVCMAQHGQVE